MSAMNAPKKLFVLLLILFVCAESFAQLVPLSLKQRVSNATVVFEGKVLSTKASWDAGRRRIYTYNLVSVYKLFKGTLQSSTVEVVTTGGTVGNDRQEVSYGLNLQKGYVGIFTCIPNNIKAGTHSKPGQLKVYSEIQGFIQYDLQTGAAKDVFHRYKSIKDDVYAPVQALAGSKYKVLKKADYNIN